MIDVSATGEGTELVPGRVPHHHRCRCCLCARRRRQLVEFGGFSGATPAMGDGGGGAVVAGGAEGASPFSPGHVDLVEALVNGQEGRLQLVLCVLGVGAVLLQVASV